MPASVYQTLASAPTQEALHQHYVVDIIEDNNYDIVTYTDERPTLGHDDINPTALSIRDWTVQTTPAGTHTLSILANGRHVIPDTAPTELTEIQYAATVKSSEALTTVDATLIV